MNNEENILELAINQLKKITKLPMNVNVQAFEYRNNNIVIDKIMRIIIQGVEILYCPEIKTTVTNTMIGYLTLRNFDLPYQQVLITKYINPILAEQLKKNNIQFIDTAGNAYINNFPIYIYTKGNKLEENNKQQIQKRIFTTKGLKIIFALLCNENLVNNPYRDIADKADVALGTVGWVMKDLREMGFLIKIGKKEKKLLNKVTLLNRWCTEYPDKLKPKLFLGKFKGIDNWEDMGDLNNEYAQWGGEVAAAKITNYLKPQTLTIYTEPDYLNYLIVNNKLKKKPDGNIEIYERFWGINTNIKADDTTHPILIYADLLATGNQRNIETAKIIYENNLKYIEKN